MTEELPKDILQVKLYLASLAKKVKSFFQFHKAESPSLALLNLALMAFLVTNTGQATQVLMSPLVVATRSVYTQQVSIPKETFAFAPDLSPHRFPAIDLSGLTYLSFFDVPLTADGQLNRDSLGYQSYTSDEARQLFERAHYNNTKALLTLSALDTNIIHSILDNEAAQYRLAEEITAEIAGSGIDGVIIDFEYPGGQGQEYQNQFSKFISLLSSQIHQNSPTASIAVAIPNSLANNQSLYNTRQLANTADKVFIIAADFSVPEVAGNQPANPVFGGNPQEYWTKLSQVLNNLSQQIPTNKLVMERAWYGNGHQYKLYVPNSQPPDDRVNHQSVPVSLGQATVDKLLEGIPAKGQAAARNSIPLIADALHKEGILNTNVLAYALATVEHETDGTFAPIDEIKGTANARRLGYEGGINYYGRGFIQITHLRNYQAIGQRIGMGNELVKKPELASEPQTAAKILAVYFKDNNVANLATEGSFVAARRPINPDSNGWLVADMAAKYIAYI